MTIPNQNPTSSAVTSFQTISPVESPLAYSLVCFAMVSSREAVKKSLKIASGLRRRLEVGSLLYALWTRALGIMGSKVSNPGPLGGVGAALCRSAGVGE
jgi:hypothetical protein